MTDSTPLLNRSKVRRSQHFPRLDASNECQYVTRSVMRQISRNLVVFMSASPCTSNYETGSYVVRVKVMVCCTSHTTAKGTVPSHQTKLASARLASVCMRACGAARAALIGSVNQQVRKIADGSTDDRSSISLYFQQDRSQLNQTDLNVQNQRNQLKMNTEVEK